MLSCVRVLVGALARRHAVGHGWRAMVAAAAGPTAVWVDGEGLHLPLGVLEHRPGVRADVRGWWWGVGVVDGVRILVRRHSEERHLRSGWFVSLVVLKVSMSCTGVVELFRW